MKRDELDTEKMNAGEIYAAVKELRQRAKELEREAFRKALIEGNGFERRAAAILGIKYTTLRWHLDENHPDLAKEAAELRAASGYAGGGKPAELGDADTLKPRRR